MQKEIFYFFVIGLAFCLSIELRTEEKRVKLLYLQILN